MGDCGGGQTYRGRGDLLNCKGEQIGTFRVFCNGGIMFEYWNRFSVHLKNEGGPVISMDFPEVRSAVDPMGQCIMMQDVVSSDGVIIGTIHVVEKDVPKEELQGDEVYYTKNIMVGQ